MKNKILFLSLAAGLMLTLTSCDGFLNVKPSTSKESGKSMSTVSDAQVALNGTYRRLTSSNYYGRRMLTYGDMKGGDFGVPTLGISDDALYTFAHEKDRNNYYSFWATLYDVILQANNILTNIANGNVITSSTAEATTLNDIKGQALMIRALAHFDLCRLYGYPYLKDNGASWGVPVVTSILDPFAKPVRNTVAEVYTQIILDLNTAIPLLPTAKRLGNMNQWAAKALLARVYLYKGDWTNAYNTAKNVIESGGYTLYSNTNWVGSWAQPNGSESIFELLIVPDESDLGNSSPRSFYRPRNDVRTDLGAAVASDIFLNMFKLYPNDVRWGMLGLDEFGNNKTPSRYIANRMGWMKKFEGDGKNPVSAVNIKMFRLSEVYLIGAEAAAKLPTPDLTNAVKWLNDIRKRNPDLAPLTINDPVNTIIAEVMLERRKELIGEGHTYFDILRTGGTIAYDGAIFFGEPSVPANGRGTTVNWNYTKCVLPIPIEEINANPGIGQQQNPGY